MADHYEALGVGREASGDEIKKAFRRIARETHPDANPGDPVAEARFRQAAEAYEVLSDPGKRARYDRGDTIDLGDLFGGLGGIDDLLRSVFGDGGLFGSGGGPRSSRGRDVLVRTEVSLEEAAFGGEATVEYRNLITCSHCEGVGAEPGTETHTCPECSGAGQVRVAQRSLLGTMMTLQTCQVCGGEGTLISHKCGVCLGKRTQRSHVSVAVEIPPGVSSGTRLRLSGRGETGGRAGRAGDLFVEVAVADDPRFERIDSDLIHQVTIGIGEATLGTGIEVPLLEGDTMMLDVPAGTQPNTTFRLRGHGMTILGRRGRGDLLVQVTVGIPDGLSAEEKDLMRRWSELRGERANNPAEA